VTIEKNTFKKRNKGATSKPGEAVCGYLDIVS
jgi:hypothetical protein